MQIGVISDTHGLARQAVLDALQGSDLIIHAGDVGKPEVLEVLQRIAPVSLFEVTWTPVRGQKLFRSLSA